MNFAVTFGPYTDAGETPLFTTAAATFMHELGHNLGLVHGGDEVCINQKPNYVSVMNYTYQLNGIPLATAPGTAEFAVCSTDRDCGLGAVCELRGVEFLGAPFCVRIDYSARKLPSLIRAAIEGR